MERSAPAKAAAGAKPKATRRRIMIGEAFEDVPCYERADLPPGTAIDGPAVIQEPSTNLIFFAGQTASVDAYGNLTVELGE